ncbi:hypothetical protein ALI22I_43045 [Saccharothrix sp. ALI-22-I]|uniref:hypothetical protein n=1 Tax=Saccharothrix sp. ALI-22-I TaxID=1933778 RepID=UPI00097BC51D|nr:hypothetical protein [Saccharothrix sp. ALI-22-I]ONI80821.1 hypothetical protein ALI22I_43045 [Saccharothrix sp. ALI-22-I]
MNTVDPARSSHGRVERRRGNPVVLAVAVIASLAIPVLGYLGGTGIGELVEQYRTKAIDSVFDDRGDEVPPFQAMWGTFGFIGCILAANLAAGAARWYRGGASTPVFPVALAFAGNTAGVWVSSREWLPPLAVGAQIDPVFHRDEKWGLWAWTMYYADRWVPATMIVMTVVAVLVTYRIARRRANVVRDVKRLLAHGRRVPADVVEVKPSGSPGEPDSHAIVTVSFVDPAGFRHRVTRRAPETGMTTGAGLAEVLFDPARPTHEKSVYVAFRRDPALVDWLPAD